MIQLIQRLWRSPLFERITIRIGSYLLLLSNIALPIGAHRLWMRLPGWYWFPVTFCLAALGATRYLATHSVAWAMLTWPWTAMFALDAWILATPPIPTSSNAGDD
jgi:hypothetical protein